jgi:hypothetical protein
MRTLLAQLVERLNGINGRSNYPKASQGILKALTFDAACRRARNSMLKLSHLLSKNPAGG